MNYPQPSRSLEVVGPQKAMPAFSITAWVGEMRQGHRARPLIVFSPKKGFISTRSHLLGLPNFPSFNELCGGKILEWEQKSYSCFSDTIIL